MGGGGRWLEREERWSERGRGSEKEGEDFPAAPLLTEVSAQLITQPAEKIPHTHTPRAGRTTLLPLLLHLSEMLADL